MLIQGRILRINFKKYNEFPDQVRNDEKFNKLIQSCHTELVEVLQDDIKN